MINQVKYKVSLWLGILILFVTSQTIAQSSISDQEARDKYKICWDAFESGRYLDCYKCCEELKKQMGKSTPKVLSLLVQSGMNALPLGIIGTENVTANQLMKLSYKNLDKVRSHVLELTPYLNAADSTNLNKRFLQESIALLELRMKPLEQERNQKPEDAIKFLNECADKFSKQLQFEKYNEPVYTFSLEKDTLVVSMRGRSDPDKPKFRWTALGEMRIPLKEVWLEKKRMMYSEYLIFYDYPFYYPGYQISTASWDNDGPVITSQTTVSGNKIFYDKILIRTKQQFANKNYEYPYEDLRKKSFEPAEAPFHLYYFIDERSKEYIQGNYRKRIEEAYSFLIEYFGGGEPRSKTQKKSYF